ncbi:hypothetical protein MBM_04917 [Drepanopeziza brunnea f. sp. 'multigermtubi' MB_m1]|uniref:Uncharacterized protein n=1 Tax=Marssonina brunnea f. sp. multigermtubi (strain MB_m1) TaxID=1072389 RepID=K1WI90_MARBU|nr:uncharacterized protein MBM_04917 [Drepanopeziza brunnea f. sp. 'multigermtubi' MB_m1]EKD17340.1 hypothetical protein MBM_04917 [Drepanopeziza brunnea f. sp. 'multigermtubi' MB_m1]
MHAYMRACAHIYRGLRFTGEQGYSLTLTLTLTLNPNPNPKSLLTETTLREGDLRESEYLSGYLRDLFGDPRKEPILRGPVSTIKQNRRVTQYKEKTDLRKKSGAYDRNGVIPSIKGMRSDNQESRPLHTAICIAVKEQELKHLESLADDKAAETAKELTIKKVTESLGSSFSSTVNKSNDYLKDKTLNDIIRVIKLAVAKALNKSNKAKSAPPKEISAKKSNPKPNKAKGSLKPKKP